MKIPFLPRISMALTLCLLLALPAFPQTLGHIGPSNGEIAALFVAAGAAVAGLGFLIYHETHRHPSITGCVASGAGGLTVKNEKDKKVYALSGDLATLKAGERVVLKGKKTKDSTRKLTFQVEKLTKDLGACHS